MKLKKITITKKNAEAVRMADDAAASIASILLSKYDEDSEDCKKLLELEEYRREARDNFEKQHAKDEYDRGFNHGWLTGVGGAWLGIIIGGLIGGLITNK